MRTILLAGLVLIAGCSETDRVSEQVEKRADRKADSMEQAGDRLADPKAENIVDQQADTVREAGEERAEAIRKSKLDARKLSEAEKAELIEGTAPPTPR